MKTLGKFSGVDDGSMLPETSRVESSDRNLKMTGERLSATFACFSPRKQGALRVLMISPGGPVANREGHCGKCIFVL